MLNEERVKHMTKMAFYETKGGSEELKISFYHKKDYIGFHTFWSVLWMTIAYIALMTILGIVFMGGLLEAMTGKQMMVVVLCVLGLYLILLFTYIGNVKQTYKRKHARAYHHAKKFKEQLDELDKMYEKEDDNE